MLTLERFASLYPNLTRENTNSTPVLALFASTYQRRSSLGKMYLVRRIKKNRWGNSPARMFDRRDKIKQKLRGMVNSRQIVESADNSLLNLNLKNIPNRQKRKAYAAIVKKAGQGVARIL